MRTILRPHKDIHRALDELASHISKLMDSIEEIKSDQKKQTDAKIRIIEDDGTYKVRFKTKAGWIESDPSSPTGFTLKED